MCVQMRLCDNCESGGEISDSDAEVCHTCENERDDRCYHGCKPAWSCRCFDTKEEWNKFKAGRQKWREDRKTQNLKRKMNKLKRQLQSSVKPVTQPRRAGAGGAAAPVAARGRPSKRSPSPAKTRRRIRSRSRSRSPARAPAAAAATAASAAPAVVASTWYTWQSVPEIEEAVFKLRKFIGESQKRSMVADDYTAGANSKSLMGLRWISVGDRVCAGDRIFKVLSLEPLDGAAKLKPEDGNGAVISEWVSRVKVSGETVKKIKTGSMAVKVALLKNSIYTFPNRYCCFGDPSGQLEPSPPCFSGKWVGARLRFGMDVAVVCQDELREPLFRLQRTWQDPLGALGNVWPWR
jgi:hypothetical protein